MPTDFSTENKETQPPRLKLLELPPPSPRTIGRLRTVSNVTPPAIYMDYGTYWAALAGGGVVDGLYNVKSFGALGDGVTDDLTAINAAIAAAAAVSNGTGITAKGAIVYFPPGKYLISAPLTLPALKGVEFVGCNWVFGTSYYSASTLYATFTNAAALDFGNAISSNVTLRRLTLAGSGGTTLANRAITSASIASLHIIECNFDQWGGSAVFLTAGSDTFIENTQVTNSLLGYASLVTQTGVVHLGGGEAVLNYCNINGNILTSVSSLYGSGYYCGIYLGGVNNRCLQTVAAFAQNGWYINNLNGGAPSTYVECRGEFNQGHGFYVAGNQNNFTTCYAIKNSQATDNTYPGIKVVADGNTFDHIWSSGISGDSKKMSNGIEEDDSNGDAFFRCNSYADLHSVNINGVTLTKAGNTPCLFAPVPYKQVLTGTGTQTFDGVSGDYFKLIVNANTTTTLAATHLIQGHTYYIEVLNSSGATPAINLDTVFKTVGYTAPADTKRKTFTCVYDGTNLILMGACSADF